MKHILFVDDDPLDTRVLRDILTMFNPADVKVSLVVDVGTALRFLRSNEVDLVVTDQLMKHGSGDDLLRLIRSGETESGGARTTSDIPVILLSGAADEHGGFTASLLKPYDVNQVIAVFEQLLHVTLAHPFRSG